MNLDTGKINSDKLKTLNSNACLSDLIEPGKELSYDTCVMIEKQQLYEVKEEQRQERIRKRCEKQVKRIREIQAENKRREHERQEEIRELEYRVRLQIREEKLIKERQKRLAAQQNATYIISSVGWQSRKRRV